MAITLQRRALSLCAALILVALLVAARIGERVTWPGSPPAPVVEVFQAVSWTASLGAAAVLVAVVLVACGVRGRLCDALALLAALAAAMVAVFTLKLGFRAPRPSSIYPGYAFPSGHSTRAAVIASWVSRRRGGVVAAAAWAWAGLVAVSRLVLHAHWLCDVVAGLLLGYCVELATEAVFNRGVCGARGG